MSALSAIRVGERGRATAATPPTKVEERFQQAKNPAETPPFLQIVAKPEQGAIRGKLEPKLTRVNFKVSRLMEFCNERELQNQTGHSTWDWPLVVAKETIDNALDACEEAEVAPDITVIVEPDTIIIQDNANGIDAETIRSILDYTVRVSSREAYCSPTRGAQGNALKTILAMGYVLDRERGDDAAGVTVIESRGVRHRIEFRVDHINNQPKIVHTMSASPIEVGTKLTIHWPPSASKLLEYAPKYAPRRAEGFKLLVKAYVWFNPHLTLRGVWFGHEFVNAKATSPDWEKWRPGNPTSAHWYDEARLQRYLAAHVSRDRDLGRRRMVREFIAEFRGLSGTAVQRKILTEVGCSHQSLAQFFGADQVNRVGVAKLLAAMKRHSKPVDPKHLGGIEALTIFADHDANGAGLRAATVDSWRNNIAKPAGDHLLLRLAISTALAGPLLYLADAEGGGVNFHGSSSKGKTTLLRVAASVWGNGNSIKTWSATGNSFEASAVVTTDTLLAIDEIGMAGTREVFSALYTLANGQGKSRLNRDASMRATRAWRVMVASTGEVPVETKIAEDNGRKARAGQLVRMIDVPATERAFGAFDRAPDGDSRAVADKFKLAATTHYGTAGPEFVRRIIADGVDGDAIRELINGFAKANVPPGSDGQIERVAGRFGIIAAAGEMATEFGLTGWGKGAATDAASWAFSQWIEAQGGGAIEERQAIAQVRQIIEQYGDSRFQSLDDCDARPVNDRLGWRQNTTDGPEWYATPENFKTQICAGLNPQKVAKILSERGMLHKQKGQGYQCTRTVFGKDLKVYVLKSILEEGKSEP